MLKYIILLAFCLPFITIGQSKKKEKKNKYDIYWEEQAKKEKYEKIFEVGNELFQSEAYYEAIEKYKEAFNLFPNDQQIIAKIRDVEIVLASGEEKEVETVSRNFTALNKIETKQTPLIKESNNKKPSIKGDSLSNAIEKNKKEIDIKKEETEKSTKEDSPETKLEAKAISEPAAKKTGKSSIDFRKTLAQDYQQGITETTYRKGNRTVTKRIVVKGVLGDEYLKVKHDWGGLFYFKNGEPIKAFIWEKETEQE